MEKDKGTITKNEWDSILDEAKVREAAKEFNDLVVGVGTLVPKKFWEDLKAYDKITIRPKDKKYDQGKPMVGLMMKDFAKALEAVSIVTTYGVKKYNQPGSWRHVENGLDRYEDALGRHDLKMKSGELYDDESEILHAAHRAWNALATLEKMLETINVKSS